MNRVFLSFILFFTAVSSFASEFSFVGAKGAFYRSSSDPNIRNFENFQVYIAHERLSNSMLRFVADDVSLQDSKLFSYTDNSAAALAPDSISADGREAYWKKLKSDHGYYVEYGDDNCSVNERCRKYLWITKYQPVGSVTWKDEEYCENVPLKVSPCMTYNYYIDNYPYPIKRSLVAKYNSYIKEKEEVKNDAVEEALVDSVFRVAVPYVNTVFEITETGFDWKIDTDTFFTSGVVAYPEIRVGSKGISELDDVSGCDSTSDGHIVHYFNDEDGIVNFRTSGVLSVDMFSYPGTNANRIEWYVGRDSSFVGSYIVDTENVYEYIFDEAGDYWIKLRAFSTSSECEFTSLCRIVISNSELFIPNTFTPNGDGINDEFRVGYKSIKKYSCHIYNQWERKVFETEDITEGWDGTVGGKKASQGVYFYIIEAEGLDGKKYKEKGTINLIRGN